MVNFGPNISGAFAKKILKGSETPTDPSGQNPPSIPPAPSNFDYYVSAAVRELHEETFEKMVELLFRKGLFYNSDEQRKKSPYNFQTPEELSKNMDFTLKQEPLLQQGNPSAGRKELLDIMEFVIDYSPHPSHPFMVHKNSSGLDPYGIVGDWLSTTMSEPVLTYFLAPVYTLMELEVEKRFRDLLGYPEDQGDGMIVPSQGLGNGFIIQIALQNKFPAFKDTGYFGSGNPKPVMFVSDQGDYGFEKYCIWEGLGSDACIRVKSDANGRMDVGDLQTKINQAKQNGFIPFLIIATAGTNVLGSIDPIDSIASLAASSEMWFHVDGHQAGSCAFSDKQKPRLKGIEKSDSCLWSPDKMLAAPFCACIIVTKERRKINKAFSFGAAYVFEQDPFYDHDKWDTGDSTLQTTRRPDILKIWFMWKAKGHKGLSDQVDGIYTNTDICMSELKKRSGRFVTILPDYDSNLVCFYFVPTIYRSLPGLSALINIPERVRRRKVTTKIKNALLKSGKMQVSVGELPDRKDLPPFFVMNLSNTALTREDIIYMLDLIECQGDRVCLLRDAVIEEGVEDPDEMVEGLERLILFEPRVPPAPTTYPDYVSAPIESLHKDLFVEYFKLVFEIGTFFQKERGETPLNFEFPEDLLQKFDFILDSSGLNAYKSVAELMNIVKSVIFYSAKLGHPYYMFQLVSGLDPYTMMADYIASCMTSPMYTYEDGPVYTLMEDELIKALLQRTKFSDGTGISFVGGSLSNQLPIFLSYIQKFQGSKKSGNSSTGSDAVIFLSSAAHYATPKGAFFQGIGMNNAVNVGTDGTGKLDPKDLEQKIMDAIAKGKAPLMVCATAGTTTLGAYDPINAIADVCEKYGVWLHVDGAYGGSVVMSDNQWFRVEGLERADSFTFNPHKMFCAARYTTNWITKHKTILRDVAPPPSKQQFRLNPDLYNGELYDHGETHVLTDRRPDVFKMWLLWKAKGTKGLGQHVDRAYETTAYAYDKLLELEQQNKRFQPVLKTPPECTNVNFYYIPEELKNSNDDKETYQRKLACVQNAVLAMLIFQDKLVNSVEAVGDIREHMIFCLYNSCLSREDVDYFFELVDFYGQNLNLDNVFSTICPPSTSKGFNRNP